MAVDKKIGIWWNSFGSHGCADQMEKILIHQLKVVIFEMVSSNISIVWDLGQLMIGCQYAISCSAVQTLCRLNAVC